eukprot:gnl/TRDRNA2_/TRDRNA2_83941_c1_seq1.p1 gnl/TRDRNA2_/TRDRNA2_83941_c1~~gnl/TRDRNA2_/TRDRNA2_83941_c1_seq1.p1  ORF type:complete len:1091 (+),score=265.04 gnl/TRDRNA2_/TRDRNA2_83941_c1_seq1:287-3274(+)
MEATGRVEEDPDAPLTVTIEEYRHLHAIMHERLGFTAAEAARLEDVFKMCDRDKGEHSHEGEFDVGEFRVALVWLGINVEDEFVRKLCKQKFNSTGLTLVDFMGLMRKYREHEILLVKAKFNKLDRSKSGILPVVQFTKLFEELGYLDAGPMTIGEIADRAGFPDLRGGLGFEDLYSLFETFRENHGFTQDELMDVDEIFKALDVDGSNDISVIELAGALRWLGFPRSIAEVMEIMEECDVDGDMGLDLGEFRKLCAGLRDEEMKSIRNAFRKYAGAHACMTIPQLRDFLKAIGRAQSGDAIEQLLHQLKEEEENPEIDLWTFALIAKKFRTEARDTLRRNAGFSESEVKPYIEKFENIDVDQSGAIEKREIANLIADVFPGCQSDPKLHKVASESLEAADDGGDGVLGFDEYLKLMRKLQDYNEERAVEKERDAIDQTAFSRDEVKEFRHIYGIFRKDHTHEMTFDEFHAMMSNLVPLGTVASTDLEKLLLSVDENSNMNLDFAEFLLVMKVVKDTDFGGINAAAEKQAAMEEARQAEVDAQARASFAAKKASLNQGLNKAVRRVSTTKLLGSGADAAASQQGSKESVPEPMPVVKKELPSTLPDKKILSEILADSPEAVDDKRVAFEERQGRLHSRLEELRSGTTLKDRRARESDRFIDFMKHEGDGSVTMAWRRFFDTDGDGELTFTEFCNGLALLKYKGDVLSLWHTFAEPQSTTITLKAIDPEGWGVLEVFGNWCYDKFGGPGGAFRALDTNGSETLTLHEFLIGLRKHEFFEIPDLPAVIGTEEMVSRNLYPLLNADGGACISIDELEFLGKDREDPEAVKVTGSHSKKSKQPSRVCGVVLHDAALEELAAFERDREPWQAELAILTMRPHQNSSTRNSRFSSRNLSRCQSARSERSELLLSARSRPHTSTLSKSSSCCLGTRSSPVSARSSGRCNSASRLRSNPAGFSPMKAVPSAKNHPPGVGAQAQRSCNVLRNAALQLLQSASKP